MSSLKFSDARPSSTVVLIRASNNGPETFMVKRHEKSSFGMAYVFPGGVLDADDDQVSESCRGLAATDANVRLGLSNGGLAYYVAAIRELFEETGVLLGKTGAEPQELASARDALNQGSENWPAFLNNHAVTLDCSLLHYVSHWVTPTSRRVRYSTRFFVAEMPEGQNAEHCGGELTDSCWVTPNEILTAARNDEVDLMFPTTKTLESMARHKTMSALMEWAVSCVEWGVTTMVPMMINRNGKQEIVLPGDRDYPGAPS